MIKKVFIYIVAVYVLVLTMYLININRAKSIQEPAVDMPHVLNQEMLRLEDYQYLLRMKQKGLTPDARILRGYRQYFQLVVDSVPNQADAYAMLGYCQYYLHQEQEAVESYGKAITINPNYIGFYYNLAVILYHQGQFQKAVFLVSQINAMDMRLSAASMLAYPRTAMIILSPQSENIQERIINHLIHLQQAANHLAQVSVDHLRNQNTDRRQEKLLLEVF